MSTKHIRRVIDIGTVIQAIFADDAAVIRVGQSGLDLTPVGALSSAVKVGANTPVMVFNSDTVVHYVAFGATESVGAPSSAANGIPIPPGTNLVVNSGTKVWIRSDSGTVFGYVADQS